jgi:hypothetical protein
MKKTTFTPEQIELLYMLSELIDFTEKHGYPIGGMLREERRYYQDQFEKFAAIHHADTIVERALDMEDRFYQKAKWDSGNKFFYIDVDITNMDDRWLLHTLDRNNVGMKLLKANGPAGGNPLVRLSGHGTDLKTAWSTLFL